MSAQPPRLHLHGVLVMLPTPKESAPDTGILRDCDMVEAYVEMEIKPT